METNKRKRLHDASINQGFDGEPKAKLPREGTSSSPPLTLADLNEDVLLKIFSELTAQDLVNIVEGDKIFLGCCRVAFKKKYRTSYVELPLKDEQDLFYVPTRKCLSRNAVLLRYFGGSISKLQVNYRDNSIDKRIFHLIVTHCRKTLTELEILCPTDKLKINKAFTKLKTLIMTDGYVDRSVYEFHKWCPMLENLVVDTIDDLPKLLNMKRKIASVKCLSINFDYDDYGPSFHIRDLHKFMKANPQINELRLTLVDDIIDTSERWPIPLNRVYDEILRDDLMTLKLNIPFDEDDTERSDVLAHFRIPTDRIAHLEIAPEFYLTAQMCAYVAKCVNLRTLKVTSSVRRDCNPFRKSSWIHSAKHEHLTQLEISMKIFYSKKAFAKVGINAIQPYLKQCKNLTTVKVRYIFSSYGFGQFEYFKNAIQARIDLKIWSFASEISPKEISFTLNKIA